MQLSYRWVIIAAGALMTGVAARTMFALAREDFGQHIMGTVFGAATMTSAIGMAIGPLLGGWVYDSFDTSSWLFIGSLAVGLGPVAVALAFPPLTAPQRQPCSQPEL